MSREPETRGWEQASGPGEGSHPGAQTEVCA